MLKPEVIPLCRPPIPSTALERLSQCLESGWLGYGPLCRELEGRFTARGGYALATANCTAALHLAARLVRREGRNRVLVPAMTFVSTAMAFTYAGLDVELVDVDPKTGLIDPQELERSISPDCCAVVAVHLYGQRADVEALRAICDLHDLTLIEDCAHRLDLLDQAAPLGDIACYSFNAVKEASGGECGLIWCHDTEAIELARQISNLGLMVDTPTRTAATVHLNYASGSELGLKLRGFDLAAALVLANLDNLASLRSVRRGQFTAYDSALAGSTALVPLARCNSDSFLMYVALAEAESREQIRKRLAEAGIATSVHYPSLSRHPRFSGGYLPRAESFDVKTVTLPCFPSMTEQQLRQMLDSLAVLDLEAEGAG